MNQQVERFTKTSTGPNISMVLNLLMYESDRNAPNRAKAHVTPMKFVVMVEDFATPVCMVPWR